MEERGPSLILTEPVLDAKLTSMTTLLPTLGVLVVFSVRAGALQNPAPPTIEQLEAAARTDSNDAETLYRLGVAYAQAGRREDAKRILLDAVRVDPQFALGYIALAQLPGTPRRIVLQNPDRPEVVVMIPPTAPADSTRLFMRRAFQINPFIETHHPEVFELPTSWVGTLQPALRHFHDGKLSQALEEFGRVIERTTAPGHPEKIPPIALRYHMLTALRIARFDDAIRDGQLSLDVAMHFAQITDTGRGAVQELQGVSRELVTEASYVLAEVYRAAGNGPEAERLYQRVLESDLSYYMAHARLAEMYETERRWVEAVSERRRAVDANPEDPSLVFALGLTLANAGVLTEADSVLRRAAAANPREARAEYVLGIVNVRLGRPAEAREAFNTFLALAPSRYAEMIADARQQLATLQH